MTGGVFLSIFWRYTVNPGVSLPLYLLFFTCGGCAALSNITHFTFVSRYDAANTTALAVGMASGTKLHYFDFFLWKKYSFYYIV